MTMNRVIGVAAGLIVSVATAVAQPTFEPDPASGVTKPASGRPATRPPGIDSAVAAALYARGQVLFASGDYANAKMLFAESLERASQGPSAANALAMLRAANEKLGVANRDDGRPGTGTSPDGIRDPYRGTPTPSGGAQPDGKEPSVVNPYGARDNSGGVLDPYGPPKTLVDEPQQDSPRARRRAYTWAAASGFFFASGIGVLAEGKMGLAGSLAGVAGGGAGLAASYFAFRKRELSLGQADAMISGGVWGSYVGALLGDVITGVDSTSGSQTYFSLGLGSLVGTGAGIYYGFAHKPTESGVLMANSFGLWGTAFGLLTGVALDPPTGEAYSLNGALGAAAGLGVGLYLVPRWKVGKRRLLWVNAGVAAGVAASWALLYPAIVDSGSTSDEQTAGAVSLATGVAGGIIAYYLTRNLASDDSAGSVKPRAGLVSRDHQGDWGLGVPAVAPVENPNLGPRIGNTLGLRLLDGEF